MLYNLQYCMFMCGRLNVQNVYNSIIHNSNWKQTKCLVEVWINRLWYMYTMLWLQWGKWKKYAYLPSIMLMELKNIILPPKSRKKQNKAACGMNLFTYIFLKSMKLYCLLGHNYISVKSITKNMEVMSQMSELW